MIWLFLTSGLFLGWSLGANDAANIFGTAVTSRMLKFKVAAVITSLFIILGAFIDGEGATNTLGNLGDVNAIAGSFTVSLAAGLGVFILIKRGLPVSVSQAIVGSIIGWNIYTSSPTDYGTLSQLLFSWILNPVLAGIFAYLIYKLLQYIVSKANFHLLELDLYLRVALVISTAIGAYSLGANNISNVVGVFISSAPFQTVNVFGLFTLTQMQQLFLLGAFSMAAGVLTYSHKTIKTVGKIIFKLTPVASLAAILSASIVLFLFSSIGLSKFLTSIGLFAFHLAPVSITQSMIGAIIGIGFSNAGKYINYKLLGEIAIGWVVTPVLAGLLCLISLFIFQNVFQLTVYKPIQFEITFGVVEEVKKMGVSSEKLEKLNNRTFENQSELRVALSNNGIEDQNDIYKIFSASKIERYIIDSNFAKEKLNPTIFSQEQIDAVKQLHGKTFSHKWQIVNRLSDLCICWKLLEKNKLNDYYNKELNDKYNTVFGIFRHNQ